MPATLYTSFTFFRKTIKDTILSLTGTGGHSLLMTVLKFTHRIFENMFQL